jgi:hypothetical protein
MASIGRRLGVGRRHLAAARGLFYGLLVTPDSEYMALIRAVLHGGVVIVHAPAMIGEHCFHEQAVGEHFGGERESLRWTERVLSPDADRALTADVHARLRATGRSDSALALTLLSPLLPSLASSGRRHELCCGPWTRYVCARRVAICEPPQAASQGRLRRRRRPALRHRVPVDGVELCHARDVRRRICQAVLVSERLTQHGHTTYLGCAL